MAAVASPAAAAVAPPPPTLDPQALADFEAGLDGLHENELMEEAEVDSVVREAILHAIGDAPWADAKVGPWTSQIVEAILKKLAGMGRPFKFVVSLCLTQKCGAGLHVAATSRCNPKTDGQLSVHWESQTVLVLATVFWAAI